MIVGVAALSALVLCCRAAGIAAERNRPTRRPDADERVAVVAHQGKTFGDGLPGLRRALEQRGVPSPLWLEVEKCQERPEAGRACARGRRRPDFAWGGDGLVQRCLDVIAGTDAALAIVPAGTANLLATNLGIPKDIEQSVEIGLSGSGGGSTSGG